MRNQEYKAAQKNKFGGIYKNNAPPKRHSIRIRYVVLVILVLLSTVTFYLHIEGDNNTLHINEFLRGAKAAKEAKVATIATIEHQYQISEMENYKEIKMDPPLSQKQKEAKNIPPRIITGSASTKEKRTYRVKSPIITATTGQIIPTAAPTAVLVTYNVPKAQGERTDRIIVRTDILIVPTLTPTTPITAMLTALSTAEPTAIPTTAKVLTTTEEVKHIVLTVPVLTVPIIPPVEVTLPHTEGAGSVPPNIAASERRSDPSVNHNLPPAYKEKEEKEGEEGTEEGVKGVKGVKEDNVELPVPQHIDIDLPVPQHVTIDPPMPQDQGVVPLPVPQDVIILPVDITSTIPSISTIPIIPIAPFIPVIPIISVGPVIPALPVGVRVVAGGVGSNAAAGKITLDDHYSDDDRNSTGSSISTTISIVASKVDSNTVSNGASTAARKDTTPTHIVTASKTKDTTPIHENSLESVIPSEVTVKKTDTVHIAHTEEGKAEIKTEKMTDKIPEKRDDKVTLKVTDKMADKVADKVADSNPIVAAPLVSVVMPLSLPVVAAPVVPLSPPAGLDAVDRSTAAKITPVVVPVAPLTVIKESAKERVGEPIKGAVKEAIKDHIRDPVRDTVKVSLKDHDAKEVSKSKIDAVNKHDVKHTEDTANASINPINAISEHSVVKEKKILSNSNVKNSVGMSTEETLIKESVMKLMQKKIDAATKMKHTDHNENTETTKITEITEKMPIIDHNVGIRGQKQDPTPQEGSETVISESVKSGTVKIANGINENSKPLVEVAPIIPIRDPALPNQVSEVMIPIVEKEKKEEKKEERDEKDEKDEREVPVFPTKKRVVIPDKKQFSSARSEPIAQGYGQGETEEKVVMEGKTRPGAHIAAVVDQSTGGVGGGGVGGVGGVSTGNVNSVACSGTMDPFAGQPVDTFKPPVNAELTLKMQWTTAVSEMLTRISRMKVGGDKLRLAIKDEIAVLQLLRIQLFCKYV